MCRGLVKYRRTHGLFRKPSELWVEAASIVSKSFAIFLSCTLTVAENRSNVGTMIVLNMHCDLSVNFELVEK